MNVIIMKQNMITRKKGLVVRTRARAQQRDFNSSKVVIVDQCFTSIYSS